MHAACSSRWQNRTSSDDPVALVGAASVGNAAEVERLLDLGFPIDTRADGGGTALHAASYAGSAPTVRLLLERGADLEAPDTSWDSTPLGWAMVGSGERHALLRPTTRSPRSPEVAELLRGT